MHPSRTVKTTSSVVLTAALLFASTGCNTKSKATPENFIKGLNAHFLDHSDCLLVDIRFPYETTDPVKTKQLDSLGKALLLEKTVESSIHVSRYTVAKAGELYAPRFCYGHRNVVSIDSNTPVAPANGFNETTVTYTYEMKEVPVWAKTPEVVAAFPDLAKAISGNATGTAVLAQTPVGWQVPD